MGETPFWTVGEIRICKILTLLKKVPRHDLLGDAEMNNRKEVGEVGLPSKCHTAGVSIHKLCIVKGSLLLCTPSLGMGSCFSVFQWHSLDFPERHVIVGGNC